MNNIIIKIELTNSNETLITSPSLRKNKLLISKDGDSWNTEKINDFLIELSKFLSYNELKIDFDEKIDNLTYKFAVELFTEFANEINKKTTKLV